MNYNPESPPIGGSDANEYWNIARGDDAPIPKPETSKIMPASIPLEGGGVIFYDYRVEKYPASSVIKSPTKLSHKKFTSVIFTL